jgi:hypothetical protein
MATIKEIVKDNKVRFSHLKNDIAYYNVFVEGADHTFPVGLNDIGEATLLAEDNAIFFMRYIRKALANNEFHKSTR